MIDHVESVVGTRFVESPEYSMYEREEAGNEGVVGRKPMLGG